MKLKLFLCCLSSLSASINGPLQISVFSGYRNDRSHWHLQEPVGGAKVYSEIDRDVQFWENGLCVAGIRRNLRIQAKGSYAAFGRGVAFQYPESQTPLRVQTNGFAADGSGLLELLVNLTPERLYQIDFIPSINYSGHFERLFRDQQRLKQTWYGFGLGPHFQITPGNGWVMMGGYDYHFLHLSFHTKQANVSAGGNMGHTGFLQASYLLSHRWSFGAFLQMHYFSSHIARTKEDQKFKLRWTSLSGSLQASREF